MGTKLTFLGAAQNVTGSRHLLETASARILVDCGLYQERDLRSRNWDPFPVKPASIDAVLLTHAHLDHSGLLPKLCREGFGGKVHSTAATREIARIVLEDSGHLQEEDAKYKRKRHEREGRKGPHPEEPLYTAEDATRCMSHFATARYGQTVRVADGVEATFHDVGHILGASFVEVAVSDGGERRTIVFSGDVGRREMPILRDPQPIPEADYLLTESTYGNRLHPSDDEATDELARIVQAAHKSGGNVVIPTFALERAQDILYHLNVLMMEKRIPPTKVFLDSPMAISVTEVFEEHPELYDEEMTRLVRKNHSPFDLPSLKLTRSVKESKAINELRGTAIVMAGSGMCTGGRIKHHLKQNITRPESTILFVGYQAVGTLGRIIVDGATEIRIHGKMHPVKATIKQVAGFSAHADRDELLRWLSSLKKAPRKAFVVHGEPESAASFAATVHERLGWETLVPEYGQQVVLD